MLSLDQISAFADCIKAPISHGLTALTMTNEVGDTVLEAETTGVVSGVLERKV